MTSYESDAVSAVSTGNPHHEILYTTKKRYEHRSIMNLYTTTLITCHSRKRSASGILLRRKDSGQAGMTNCMGLMSLRLKKASGFTLLEIIVVVFILGLLAAIVAPKIMGRTDDAKIADAKVQIRNFETGLKLFKIDNGFYPDTEQGLDSLITKPSAGKIPQSYREGGYLEQKKIPLDPWGNPYVYVSPGIHGDFDIMSYGGDGKEGGEGKDADITNWGM
jgi:general secretion pathway protein G